MMRISPGPILLLALLILATPARGASSAPAPDPQDRSPARDAGEGVPWARAHVIKSDHFEVRSNCSREQARRYSALLEAAYETLSDLFGGVGKPPKERRDVYILRSRDDFVELTGKERVVGYYATEETPALPARTVVTYHGVRSGTEAETNTVLLRQSTYQFAHRILGDDFGNVPVWLIHGTAVFFESCRIEEGKVILREEDGRFGSIPGERLISLQEGIGGEDGRYIRLRSLIRTPGYAFGGYHYAHAWSLVHWMMNADGGEHRSTFDAIWKAGRAGRVAPEEVERLIEKATGRDIDSFEEEIWKPYVLGLEPPSTGGVAGERFSSQRMGLSIVRPGAGWTWVRKGLPEGVGVRLQNEKAGATIDVAARPSGISWKEIRERGMDSFFADAVEAKRGAIEKERGREGEIEEEELTVGREKAARWEYTTGNDDGGEGDEEGEDGAKTKGTRNLLVIIPTADRHYEIRCACPAEKADEVEPDFDKLIRTFKVLP